MADPFHHRESCRLCDSRNVAMAVPMAPSAIADAYLPPQDAEASKVRFPLDLYLCSDCGHLQLLDVVHPDVLFREYTFRTSSSAGLIQHFRRYADDVCQYVSPPTGSLAVEIGSNDGTLLRFFQERGLRTVGVDPAYEIATEASAAGIETIPAFFTSNLATQIAEQHGKAKVVAANNVFAHADDLADIAEGVRTLLAPDGVFVFEVSYLVDIVENMLFDTVYHEHLCYHSIKPLHRFLARHGLMLINVQRLPVKGGSIRCFAQLNDSIRPVATAVPEMLAMEAALGMDQLTTFERFAARIAECKRETKTALSKLKSAGATAAGFGASATVTTLLHQFDLADDLEFLVDDNQSKWGLLSPGHHLRVRPPQDLKEQNIGCVVILAWAYATPILNRHRSNVVDGGRFLIPLPTLQIL